MNKKFLILLIIIVISIIYFQYGYINKINNNLEILQYKNPKKDKFEKLMQEKTITIFTDIHLYNPNNININKTLYKKNTNNIDKLIENNLNYYNIPLCIKSNFALNFKESNTVHHLIKQKYYRRLIYMISGTKRIIIFNNSQEKYLYVKNNVSQVNFWQQDLDKFPLINKSKYIEIILKDNMMISLPYNCIFTSINVSPTIYVDFYSESLFSNFLKI